MSRIQKPTDQLGQQIEVGDRIVVADNQPGSTPAHVLAHRKEPDGTVMLLTIQGGRGGEDLVLSSTRRASEVRVVPRDPAASVEQFLPVGARFSADYLRYGGWHQFVVRHDGRVRDEEGWSSSMEALKLSSIRHVSLPAAFR